MVGAGSVCFGTGNETECPDRDRDKANSFLFVFVLKEEHMLCGFHASLMQ